MGLLAFLIVGFVAGLIARSFTPGDPGLTWPATTLLGLVGAVVGGMIGSLLSPGSRLFDIRPGGLILSVLGAAVLLWISASTDRRIHT